MDDLEEPQWERPTHLLCQANASVSARINDGGGDITNDACFRGEEAANAVRWAGRRWS